MQSTMERKNRLRKMGSAKMGSKYSLKHGGQGQHYGKETTEKDLRDGRELFYVYLKRAFETKKTHAIIPGMFTF